MIALPVDPNLRSGQPALVNTAEEPVDVVQRTLDPDVLPLEGRTRLPASSPKNACRRKRMSTRRPQGGAPAPVVSPRKVRTMVVRPDGSIVAREDPEPETAAPESSEAAPQAARGCPLQADAACRRRWQLARRRKQLLRQWTQAESGRGWRHQRLRRLKERLPRSAWSRRSRSDPSRSGAAGTSSRAAGQCGRNGDSQGR
jgi:hypothetical protein